MKTQATVVAYKLRLNIEQSRISIIITIVSVRRSGRNECIHNKEEKKD